MTECSVCKTQLADDAKFCSACGTAVAGATGPIEETFSAAVEFVGNVAGETSRQVSGVLRDETAQKIAGGAAVGALAAIVLPVSLGVGALIGAGVVAYRQFEKR